AERGRARDRSARHLDCLCEPIDGFERLRTRSGPREGSLTVPVRSKNLLAEMQPVRDAGATEIAGAHSDGAVSVQPARLCASPGEATVDGAVETRITGGASAGPIARSRRGGAPRGAYRGRCLSKAGAVTLESGSARRGTGCRGVGARSHAQSPADRLRTDRVSEAVSARAIAIGGALLLANAERRAVSDAGQSRAAVQAVGAGAAGGNSSRLVTGKLRRWTAGGDVTALAGTARRRLGGRLGAA